MKRRDIEKELKKLGFVFVDNGGNHDLFMNEKGIKISVPRHREIKENTAKTILKMAKR
ncbi:type II toxin-antitoxin system HicA family toxin [Murdochiella sp. Marseille-P8839]|nr:type II toxin-antitoxin system HicA family toxin [Murdochiella sp. Marseille-P8839]